MAVTAEEVRVFVGAETGEHTALIADSLSEALTLVAKYVGTAPVAEALRDRAVLEVAADLFHRRNAPNGITNQFDIADGQPLRISRDPMAPAYKILRISPW